MQYDGNLFCFKPEPGPFEYMEVTKYDAFLLGESGSDISSLEKNVIQDLRVYQGKFGFSITKLHE